MKHLMYTLLCLFFIPFSWAQASLLDSVSLAIHSEFTDLKEALKQPNEVVKLNLRKKGLKDFPIEICQFRNLQFLDLGKNKIKSLPDSIVNLKNLQFLIVNKNDLEALPNNIGDLRNLKHLNASQNRIGRIPYSFGKLENLEYLDLWDNELDYFPETMKNLVNLEVMDLRNILIPQENQDAIQAMLPNTKIYFSPACKCAW